MCVCVCICIYVFIIYIFHVYAWYLFCICHAYTCLYDIYYVYVMHTHIYFTYLYDIYYVYVIFIWHLLCICHAYTYIFHVYAWWARGTMCLPALSAPVLSLPIAARAYVCVCAFLKLCIYVSYDLFCMTCMTYVIDRSARGAIWLPASSSLARYDVYYVYDIYAFIYT